MKKIRRLLVFMGLLALFNWGCGPSAPPPPPPPPTIPTTTLPPAPKTFTVPDVGIEMVPIPAGKFTMGSFIYGRPVRPNGVKMKDNIRLKSPNRSGCLRLK